MNDARQMLLDAREAITRYAWREARAHITNYIQWRRKDNGWTKVPVFVIEGREVSADRFADILLNIALLCNKRDADRQKRRVPQCECLNNPVEDPR
jgi:hypothetical protein